ncbi:MAG TPA: hypothetical protein VGN75_13410, partial [Kaistia sp.]|nr:hypothetical protein [Kaistia sp.]
ALLAEGQLYQNQAFQYGPAAFGFQFHIELTLAMMHRWTTTGADRFALPGAQPRAQHMEGRAVYDAQTSQFLDSFLDFWLRLPRGEAAATEAPAARREPVGLA